MRCSISLTTYYHDGLPLPLPLPLVFLAAVFALVDAFLFLANAARPATVLVVSGIGRSTSWLDRIKVGSSREALEVVTVNSLKFPVIENKANEDFMLEIRQQ